MDNEITFYDVDDDDLTIQLLEHDGKWIRFEINVPEDKRPEVLFSAAIARQIALKILSMVGESVKI